MTKLAASDLETEIPGRGRRDELGRMADASQVFRENAIDRKRLEDEPVHELHINVDGFLATVRQGWVGRDLAGNGVVYVPTKLSPGRTRVKSTGSRLTASWPSFRRTRVYQEVSRPTASGKSAR